jgi:hypothetical protein
MGKSRQGSRLGARWTRRIEGWESGVEIHKSLLEIP